jgi:hypothetical protein
MSTDPGFWQRLRGVGPEAVHQLLDDHVPEGILLEFKRFSVPTTGVFDIHEDIIGTGARTKACSARRSLPIAILNRRIVTGCTGLHLENLDFAPADLLHDGRPAVTAIVIVEELAVDDLGALGRVERVPEVAALDADRPPSRHRDVEMESGGAGSRLSMAWIRSR